MKRGKIPFNSLIRSVLRVPFERKEVDHLARDGVFLGEGRHMASMNTLLLCGELKESFAFYKAFNGALASGMKPDKLLLSMVLPECVTEPETKEIMQKFQQLSRKNDVQIVGGSTLFSDSVKRPVFTLVFTGGEKDVKRCASENDAIILTKEVGSSGIQVLLEDQMDMLSKRFSLEFLEGAKLKEDMLSCKAEVEAIEGIKCLMHDVSEGGIFAALYELSEGYKCGFTVDLKSIGIRQETVEITEVLDLNPYTLYSTGCMLIVTDEPDLVLQKLAERNIPSAQIGTIIKGKKKIIKKGDEERFLERPERDSVYLSSSIG